MSPFGFILHVNWEKAKEMKQALLTIITIMLTAAICHGQASKMRPLSELTDPEGSGWDAVMQWKESATNKVEFLPKDPVRADSVLYQLQLSTASPIAAMVHGCGGVLIEDGWIRILGSGCKELDRSLPSWNKGKTFGKYGEEPSYLLIADDVLGGLFAINAGGIDEYDIGKIFYFGPNKLKWVTTGLGYNEFIVFCFTGDLEKFYNGFRWDGWKEEVNKLNGNQVISCYPLLWTDAGKDLQCNRKVVSVQKQWAMYKIKPSVAAKKSPKKNISTRKKVKTTPKVLSVK